VRELRAVAVTGVLAILATAWIGRPLGELAAEPAVFGLAYLGMAVAIAIRFGAIPFHLWAARLADAAPENCLPMLMAWGPAALAVVGLAWTDAFVAPLVLPLGVEQGLVIAIGVASIVLGAVAALVQDDLEHVLAYTIMADAGVVVLALGLLDPEAWAPARTWILAFIVARSAFAAWVVAIRGAYGTRRIPELRGWAIRGPVLAAALVLIIVASIGWPGQVAFDARVFIIDLALGRPLAWLVVLGAIAPVVVYGRLLYVGLQRPGPDVIDGASERPSWPGPVPSRPMVGLSTAERAFERAGHAVSGTVDVAWAVPQAIRVNRVPLVAIAVLLLAGLSFAVSGGGFGVVQAAREVPGVEAGQPGPVAPDELP
jgi:formate hydrogenlyase subunit 3/multisubunit Na+/H+ antiporter MnhD subunit